MPPIQQQSGVIPYRRKEGRVHVLLITSRGGKKWIVPKGFIEADLSPAESAAKEAFEEAGVTGRLQKKAIGAYRYNKWGQVFEVTLYLLKVRETLTDWPEAEFRQRQWVSLKRASVLVQPSGLKKMLLSVPDYLPV